VLVLGLATLAARPRPREAVAVDEGVVV